uniref:Uncharacterized protein n=1 Tax=Nelumbo nucifera TaxID=4432 RepID=A0A822XIU7_NELNU|nr:TPA_asm: hypothetical protein HUJ06_020432 [Nelumbo nucifera]
MRGGDGGLNTAHLRLRQPPQVPAILKRSSSSRRVLCLDLNLMPLENDLDLQLGRKMPPIVDCFI